MDEPQDVPVPDEVTRDLFLQYQHARRGTAHAEDMTNPVWDWLVRTRLSAYGATAKFVADGGMPAKPGWCFQRMGQTSTRLPNGREILVAGEHEDHYDPDFYIYNDVIVKYPDDSIRIFGYPESEFPPTDFHTATLLDDQSLLLIGNLSYDRFQQDSIQVLRLDCDSMKISKVVTHGNSPGWLYEHEANVRDDGLIVVSGGNVAAGTGLIENIDDWSFDPVRSHWSRLTMREWPLVRILRTDASRIHHWEYEQAVFERQHQIGSSIDFEQSLREEGIEPDFDLFDQLFVPPVSHIRLPDPEDKYGVVRLEVEGVVIRYNIEMYCIDITFEGSLLPEILRQVADDLRQKLTRVESSTCRVEWLRSAPE